MTHNGNEPYARCEIANIEPPRERWSWLTTALLAVSGIVAVVVFGWLWSLIP